MSWDLTPFFASFDGEEYREFRAELERDLAKLCSEIRALGGLARDRLGAWAEVLVRLEDATARSAHLASYLGCLSAADSRDEAVARELASASAALFLTLNGAPGDTSTLAHELGHAFHGELMSGVRPWSRRSPMTLAETASTFAEQAVIDASLARAGGSAASRLAILDGRLQDAAVFLLNIPARFSFEKAVYEERASGELPVSRLCALMLEAEREWYGDALDGDDLDPWFWASKLHFYITSTSFYNFPYTFGYLFSLGLFASAKREGPSFMPRYEALLRATGGGPAEAVARDAIGVDLSKPDFWHESLDLVEETLTEFLASSDS